MRRIPSPADIPPDKFNASFTEMRQLLEVDYSPCPRCGKEHTNLLLQKFGKPMITEHVIDDRGSIDSISQYFTHWALCPVLHEPIVFSFNMRLKKE